MSRPRRTNSRPYAWDALNRLQSVALPNGIVSNHVYRFDDLLSNIQTAQGTKQLIWEGGNVLAHLRSDSFGNSVAFIKTDTTTKGAWPYVYGSEGRDIQSLTPVLPAYCLLSITGASTNTWAASSSDPRSMITAPGASTRVAADWFSATSFTIDLTFTDCLAHNVAFYCLDWDNLSRTQRIDVLDGDTGALLDTRSLSAFSGGIWLVWRLKGHIKLNFVNTTGGGASANAVLSGFCFDPATVSPAPSAGELFTHSDRLVRAT